MEKDSKTFGWKALRFRFLKEMIICKSLKFQNYEKIILIISVVFVAILVFWIEILQ
jgi:hypothetical protein